jgi:hypothetical protein
VIEDVGLSETEALRAVVDDVVVDAVGVSDCVLEPVAVLDGVNVAVTLPVIDAEGVLKDDEESDAVAHADAPRERVDVRGAVDVGLRVEEELSSGVCERVGEGVPVVAPLAISVAFADTPRTGVGVASTARFGDGDEVADGEGVSGAVGTPVVEALKGEADGEGLADSDTVGVGEGDDAEVGEFCSEIIGVAGLVIVALELSEGSSVIDGVAVGTAAVPRIATLSTRNVLVFPTPHEIRQQKLAAFEASSGRSPVDHPKAQPVDVMGRSATGCVKFTPSIVHSRRAQFGEPLLFDPLL